MIINKEFGLNFDENPWQGNGLAPESLETLQNTARERKNVFEQLMEAVKYNSLGQISHALYDVGGEYRRNM
jgi:isobutyryl-CoA mutase